jgi:hypothetical protein
MKEFNLVLILLYRSEWDQSSENKAIISPIFIMLEGLSLRFRFHFETSKPTNRIDKVKSYYNL